VARKRKKLDPAAEAESRALAGLWLLERRPGAAPKVLLVGDGFLDVHDFGDAVSYMPTAILCVRLETREGQRLILHSDDGVVLFRYRLEGDTLELEDRPTDRPGGWEVDHPAKWELEGRWLRLITTKST
jgi:hypothetical protein